MKYIKSFKIFEGIEDDMRHVKKSSIQLRSGGDLYFGQNVDFRNFLNKERNVISVNDWEIKDWADNKIEYYIVKDKVLSYHNSDARYKHDRPKRDQELLTAFNSVHKTNCTEVELN